MDDSGAEGMKVSQRELARTLKVSTATVSKAFRNASDIGPTTRAKILAEASRLGYQPPLASRKAAERAARMELPSRMIGVLYCQNGTNSAVTDHKNVLYLDGLSEAAVNCGATLVVHRVSGDGSELLATAGQPVALREGMLSGLVLIYKFGDEVVRRLSRMIPAVTITHWVPEAGCDHIDSDHITGMNRLVRYLKTLGHRKIGFVSTDEGMGWERSRYTSTLRALMQEGYGADHATLWCPDMRDAGDAERVVDGMVAGIQQGVTAWMCSCDGFAQGLIRRLDERGVRVPQDLSVTGFDGFDHSATSPWQMTTVRTPFHEMGIVALEQLMRRIDAPGRIPVQVLVDCPLIQGQTAGAAPRS